jgi:CelD/BcsL family acetyltransferase involved in cellulose biosynthesis
MTKTPPTGEVVAPAALDAEDIARWTELMDADPALGTPFLSYGYTAVAAQVFPIVRVLRLRSDGRTVGFFPFQFRTPLFRWAGIADRVAGELSDYFGMIAEQSALVDPNTLLRLAGLKALLFTHLDETQSRYGLSGQHPEPGLRIRLASQGTPFWTQLREQDKKFVSDTERRERKLVEKHGQLRFVFRHPDPLPALRDLIAAKRAQYARTAVADPMEAKTTRHFLEHLAGMQDPTCRAVLSTLHAGDTWVASHFGLMYRRTLHYWFPVYNPALKSFAPGRLLVAAIVRSAGENDVACIDRGAGDSPAKKDFATEQHHFVRGLWHLPGLSSTLYRAGLSVSWRVARARGASRRETAVESSP